MGRPAPAGAGHGAARAGSTRAASTADPGRVVEQRLGIEAHSGRIADVTVAQGGNAILVASTSACRCSKPSGCVDGPRGAGRTGRGSAGMRTPGSAAGSCIPWHRERAGSTEGRAAPPGAPRDRGARQRVRRRPRDRQPEPNGQIAPDRNLPGPPRANRRSVAASIGCRSNPSSAAGASPSGRGKNTAAKPVTAGAAPRTSRRSPRRATPGSRSHWLPRRPRARRSVASQGHASAPQRQTDLGARQPDPRACPPPCSPPTARGG